MKPNIRNIFTTYSDFIKERIPISDNSIDPISAWRHRFFLQIMIYIAPGSIIAYIPSMLASMSDDFFHVAIIDTIVFIGIQVILFTKSMGLKTKKIVFISLIYILGNTLLFSLGFGGPGLIYITAVSVISALIFNSTTGYWTIALNIITILVTYFININEILDLKSHPQPEIPALLTYIANYTLISFVIILAISSLIKTLSKNLETLQSLNMNLLSKNEELSIAMEKARESDKLKSTFLNNMSHEVRTPLNGIIGFSQLMKEDINSIRLSEHCDQVIASGFKLLQIITDIIDASIITNNQVKIINSKVDFIAFIESEVDKWNKPQYGNNMKPVKILFHNNLAKDIEEVSADKEKLTKTIDHVLSNAVKYSKNTTIDIKIEWEQQDEIIRIAIKDNGIGIAPENHQIIFNPFFQINESYCEGNGLGLFIAKGFVEKWGGTISLSSTTGIGSTFSFTLPIKP